MASAKAHCRSEACYGRLCERCLRKELPEKKLKGSGMILAKPCESVPTHFALQRMPGNIFYLEEKCQIMQYTQIPQKSGELFNYCKLKSLCDFLKLAVPCSQDDANLLSD